MADFDILGFESKSKREVERDSRRNFTDSQKNEIWDNQNGKCSDCKNSLMRTATHYDHIIPWELGGKTEMENGQALCANCHARKTNKEKVNKVDKKRKQKTFASDFSGILPKFSKSNILRL